jgi:Ala-tRNA(Pro) deacylase
MEGIQDSTSQAESAYSALISLLDRGRARYRLLDHAPEGRTELVSKLRGNDLAEAAKCMVVMVKRGKKVTKYVLAVVPGNSEVDLNEIKRLYAGSYASFASRAIAERLAGSEAGTILPFSFSTDLELIADPSLLRHYEIFFNASRLDRSIALHTADYVSLARPRLEPIGQPA